MSSRGPGTRAAVGGHARVHTLVVETVDFTEALVTEVSQESVGGRPCVVLEVACCRSRSVYVGLGVTLVTGRKGVN